MNINYKVKGLKNTLNQIKLFSKRKQEQVNDDIHAAGLHIETEAKKRTPINKQNGVGGVLRNSNQTDNTKPFRSVVGNSANYASFVEFGTRAHIITPKTKKVLSDGKNVFGKKVNHPGTKAQPFLRPAFEIGVKDVQRTLKRTLSTFK